MSGGVGSPPAWPALAPARLRPYQCPATAPRYYPPPAPRPRASGTSPPPPPPPSAPPPPSPPPPPRTTAPGPEMENSPATGPKKAFPAAAPGEARGRPPAAAGGQALSDAD